jgi:hypothetical protein
MASGDLIDIDSALEFLQIISQITDPDAADVDTVSRLVSATSAQIQTFLGYQVAQASYTRTFNGSGGQILVLPDRPVTAVASVSVDGYAVPASSSPLVDGFVFDDKFIYLRGSHSFSPGFQNVAVSYTAGYSIIPADIAQACLDWVGVIFQSQGRDTSVVEKRVGDTTIKYGTSLTQLPGSNLIIPPIIAAALMARRRVSM